MFHTIFECQIAVVFHYLGAERSDSHINNVSFTHLTNKWNDLKMDGTPSVRQQLGFYPGFTQGLCSPDANLQGRH